MPAPSTPTFILELFSLFSEFEPNSILGSETKSYRSTIERGLFSSEKREYTSGEFSKATSSETKSKT